MMKDNTMARFEFSITGTGREPIPVFRKSVSDKEYQLALKSLEEAISRIDTPEEWLDITKKITFAIIKLAASQLPIANVAAQIAMEIFEDSEEILQILRKLWSTNNES